MFGVVEVDESLFGAKRVKGKRGREAYSKTTALGIFERDGQVYTEIVPNSSKATLQAIIAIRSTSQPLSILTAGAVRTGSLISKIDTFELIIRRMNSRKAAYISMASKAFGALQRSGSPYSKASKTQRFSFI